MAQKNSGRHSQAARKGKAARARNAAARAAADAGVVHGKRLQWTKAEVEEAFRRFAAANPVPRGELEYTNPFTLLVAIVLSAQATDAGVNKATPALFKIADTPKKMAMLGEEKLKTYIKTIGLFNSKAKNIILLSERLVKEFNSKIPESR